MLKVLVFLVGCACLISVAAGSEELQDARGGTVLAVGKIERYSCPGLGLYDCSGWPLGLYRFSSQGICFTSTESCSYDCQAVLLEKEGQQSLLLFGGRYREQVRKSSGSMKVCPQGFAQKQ